MTALAVAGVLGLASHSFAAGKVECSILKDGKHTTQMVDNREACTKLGGTVVTKEGAK